MTTTDASGRKLLAQQFRDAEAHGCAHDGLDDIEWQNRDVQIWKYEAPQRQDHTAHQDCTKRFQDDPTTGHCSPLACPCSRPAIMRCGFRVGQFVQPAGEMNLTAPAAAERLSPKIINWLGSTCPP